MIRIPFPRRAALALGLAGGLLGLPATRARPVDEPRLAEVELQLVDLTNRFRRAEGRFATAPSAQLAAAARGFADYMALNERYGHDADGRRAVERAREQGYADCLVAENIALRYSSAGFDTEQLAEEFFEGWRDSPGHRRNMLDRDATETAVAVARSPRGRYYAVQMFGRPAVQRIRFQIGNRAGATVHYEVDGRDFALPPRATRTHEQCRKPALRLQLPGETVPQLVEPADGERFSVEQGPHWRLERH